MNVLALDLATRTGWALMEDDRLESGVETFDVKPGESPGIRYAHFERWLEDMGARAELVAYEQVSPSGSGGAASREIPYGFVTRVQGYCARRGIDHATAFPSAAKKFASSRGNAGKAEVLEAVARRWRRSHDDREADALALLHHALDAILPAVAAAAKPQAGGQGEEPLATESGE